MPVPKQHSHSDLWGLWSSASITWSPVLTACGSPSFLCFCLLVYSSNLLSPAWSLCCSSDFAGMILPRGLCTCYYLHLGCTSSSFFVVLSLTCFRFLFYLSILNKIYLDIYEKGHILSGVFSDHPIYHTHPQHSSPSPDSIVLPSSCRCLVYFHALLSMTLL